MKDYWGKQAPGNHTVQQPCHRRLFLEPGSASATEEAARIEAAKHEFEVAGMEQGVRLTECLKATRGDKTLHG